MNLAIPAKLAPNLRDCARYLQRGELRAAEQALQPLLRRLDKHPEVLRLQGILYHHQQRYEQAIQCYRQALQVQPRRAAIHNNLASALRASGQLEAAINAFKRAVTLQPDLAAAWFNLGKTLKAHAYIDEALEPLQRALTLQPQHHAARIALGDVQKALGDLQQAAAAYREVIRQTPTHAGAWWALSNLKTEQFDSDDVAAIKAALSQYQKAGQDRRAVEACIRLNFALFKALEDCGDYPAAFAALREGNRLQKERLPWDRDRFTRQLRALIETNESLTPAAQQPRLQDGQGVVFVVSLPRSGSTLLEHILAAHSAIEGASELPDLPATMQARLDLAEPRGWNDLNDSDWHQLGAEYWRRTQRWRPTGSQWFIDKLPNNWVWSEAILRALPQAVILDCRRDPRDTCFSNYTQLFALGQAFSYDLHDLIAYWRSYEETMDAVRARYPQRVVTVHYEQLVDEPRPQVQRVLDTLGLAWEAACLDYNRTQRVVRTASAAQVRQPLKREKQARWRRYKNDLYTIDAKFFS